MKIENPARSSAPVAVPDLHPSKWRTPRAIPAHAPQAERRCGPADDRRRLTSEPHQASEGRSFAPHRWGLCVRGLLTLRNPTSRVCGVNGRVGSRADSLRRYQMLDFIKE